VLRHLVRVPFENVSKLLLFGREGKGRVTTLPEFLDGIEQQDLGGTCYQSKPFLAELLRVLGYDADLLGADMSNPNVHTNIRVRIGAVPYHVDVGYAAPFGEPLRLDQLPHEIPHGSCRYVLDRDSRGEGFEVTQFSGRERVHGYVVHDPPRCRDFFKQIILDSYSPGMEFMGRLRITRFFEDHTVELRNTTLLVYRGGVTTKTELKSMTELESAIANDLSMPRCPIAKAVEILEGVTGKRFFEV